MRRGQAAAASCPRLDPAPGPGSEAGQGSDSLASSEAGVLRAASLGAGPPVEKGAGEGGPRAALCSQGATARGLVRGRDRTAPAWQPWVQMASIQHAARKKGGLSGSSELSQGMDRRCA